MYGPPDIMTRLVSINCVSLLCLVVSAGRLSPPRNVSLELLDFAVDVHWQPSEANHHDTRYIVELQQIGEQWTPSCTNILLTKCHMSVPENLTSLMKNYFVRVKAKQADEYSDWSHTASFQPYGDTVLSGPVLHISSLGQNQSISVSMSHHVKSVLPNLTYNVTLFWNNSGQEIMVTQVHSGRMWHVFDIPALDYEYCVKATAIHLQQQRRHQSSVKCAFLRKVLPVSYPVIWTIVLLLLLVLLVGILLSVVLNYINPRISRLPRPCFLNEKEKPAGVLGMDLAKISEVSSPILTALPNEPTPHVYIPRERLSKDESGTASKFGLAMDDEYDKEPHYEELGDECNVDIPGHKQEEECHALTDEEAKGDQDCQPLLESVSCVDMGDPQVSLEDSVISLEVYPGDVHEPENEEMEHSINSYEPRWPLPTNR